MVVVDGQVPDTCRTDVQVKMPPTPPPTIRAQRPPNCEPGCGCIYQGTVLHKKIDIPPCERACPDNKGRNLPHHQCFYQDEVVTPKDETCCCHCADPPARCGGNPGGNDPCNPCPPPPITDPCNPPRSNVQGAGAHHNTFITDRSDRSCSCGPRCDF